jgi:hypothetical protein
MSQTQVEDRLSPGARTLISTPSLRPVYDCAFTAIGPLRTILPSHRVHGARVETTTTVAGAYGPRNIVARDGMPWPDKDTRSVFLDV